MIFSMCGYFASAPWKAWLRSILGTELLTPSKLGWHLQSLLILLDKETDPPLLWTDLKVVGYSNNALAPKMLFHICPSMQRLA